jgi:hypothetical protein
MMLCNKKKPPQTGEASLRFRLPLAHLFQYARVYEGQPYLDDRLSIKVATTDGSNRSRFPMRIEASFPDAA